MNSEDECPICFEHQVCKIMFNVCNHLVCKFCCDKMSDKKCPLCNIKSVMIKIYHPVFDLKFIAPHVMSLYDKVVISNIVQETYITQLLIEYVKWLKLVAENDSLIPSVLIGKLWAQHILDANGYSKTCNNLGVKYVHKNVNTNVMSIMCNIFDTKKRYEKLYGDEMLKTKFWEFDNMFDIGVIVGKIHIRSVTTSMVYLPFSLTMTCKHLILIVENHYNQSYLGKLRFIFCGKVIPNDAILSQNGVEIDSVIMVVFPLFRCD